jgi:hypothetical protein
MSDAESTMSVDPTTCRWYEDRRGEDWVAGCETEHRWCFADGGTPADNHMTHCGYCGKPIEVVPAPDAEPEPVDLID